jgi:hypothetical protein
MVVNICNPSYMGGPWSKAGLGKKCETLSKR